MTAEQAIALVSSLITIASFCGNVIQYKNRKSLIQRLRSFAQEEFMHHYMIARACTRLRHSDEKATEKILEQHQKEIHYINGFADAARNNIIAVSKYQLEFTPEFIHPGYPERVEQDDKIKMGTGPSLRRSEILAGPSPVTEDQV